MSRIIDYMRELDLVSSEKIKRYFMKNNLDTIMSFDKYHCINKTILGVTNE
jgi:hypothetical protein